jgi:hypothetical protein
MLRARATQMRLPVGVTELSPVDVGLSLAISRATWEHRVV